MKEFASAVVTVLVDILVPFVIVAMLFGVMFL